MNINQRIQQLEYNYAQIDVSTGRCHSVFTSSYEIPLPDEYILIPEASIEYRDKYYHDGHWYADAEFTIACPELDW